MASPETILRVANALADHMGKAGLGGDPFGELARVAVEAYEASVQPKVRDPGELKQPDT